ncbi:VraH family peptide resistance protein [Staphylococcus simulans]|uniref:VraH family peptide resistance protein n=1 Tax=Staphylococcus simulans TaxID=1286 RepID=UPI0039996E72
MSIKEYVQDVIETIKHMRFGSKNGIIMIVSAIVLSAITTPIVGLPLGAWIGYYLEKNGK